MISKLRIRTKRLDLIAGTAEMGRAELTGSDKLATYLNAEIPPDWPPPLNDIQSTTWFADYLEQHPDAVGWASWYFVLRSDNERRVAIGNGGFKGRVDEHGTAEIGYSILERHQRRGYAPEAVRALVSWALSDPGVRRVVAQTLPGLAPSIAVLEKCGFSFVGKGMEEGAILYELHRHRRRS